MLFGKILKIFLFLISMISFVGCAGYHSYSYTNPFKIYDIKSISIPLFVNKSIFPGLNAKLTQSISNSLLQYPGLHISFGENYSADAFLIGIVRSKSRVKNVFIQGNEKFINGDLKKSIGSRQEFYIPTTKTYSYSLEIYLIKNPSKEKLDFLHSPITSKIKSKLPEMVYSKTLIGTGSFSEPLKSTEKNDNGGVVNFTQSQGNYKDSLESSASNIAANFKQMVVNELF